MKIKSLIVKPVFAEDARKIILNQLIDSILLTSRPSFKATKVSGKTRISMNREVP